MTDVTLDAARPHMAALADDLTKAGAIRSKPWAEAFAAVPRHVFVPRWFEQEANAKGITVWRQRRVTDEGALPDVYRDVTLVTGLDPETVEQVDETAWTGIPTSSTTLPSLMARMLEDLDLHDGHRVLEIGTGTGYNAALLCARLRDHHVHSVDVDPDLVTAAEQRLVCAGYAPRLLPADGTHGCPTGGPFDRIIATCSVPSIPSAWTDQLRAGGVLLADVALGIEGGLVRLTGTGTRQIKGHFTTTTGRFMPARGEALTYPQPQRPQRTAETGTRPTQLTAAAIRAHYPLRLLLAFHLPGAQLVYHVAEATGDMSIQLQCADGSWARVPLDGQETATVTWGGDGDLWKRAEATWLWWNAAGRPAQDQFGYAQNADGAAYAWYLADGTRWDLST
ncbi:methyltransferase domain-containing protein [Streptomyces sp. TRM68416]|uniref:methyltransferase domain-containing protein n=1 Tax=Streptomyces sp. TRM68416 TaxID=2758412 RepID=UPI001CB74744|nr:methyltransferase domain-containing protein [Streptomyces sp. TRM68416]